MKKKRRIKKKMAIIDQFPDLQQKLHQLDNMYGFAPTTGNGTGNGNGNGNGIGIDWSQQIVIPYNPSTTTTAAKITLDGIGNYFAAVETKVLCISCKKIHSESLMQQIKIGNFQLNTNICQECLSELIDKIKCDLGLEIEDKKEL